jgi:GT2 family glycosyltransferase
MKPARPSSTSVVVCTYNNPRALAIVLDSLARQTAQDFEIVVADDGSRDDTRELIDRFRATARQEVVHLWHPDEGVRRGAMANKAILAAKGEYLVFLDGDCVPPARWLASHLESAERGWFVVGGKVLMSERLTTEVVAGRVDPRRLERPSLWWREIQKSRRLATGFIPGWRRLWNRNHQGRCSWIGEDSSTFAEHLRAIGGFDERFTLLWDDADTGRRLRDAGFQGRSIRYLAPVLHLEHGRSYRTKADEESNLRLFQENEAQGIVVTPYGLALHQ